MKNKRYIIILTVLFIFILYGIGLYKTQQKFVQPEQKYYGLNETAICDGMSYRFISMDTYLIDELAAKYEFNPEDLFVTEEYTRRYYVACVEVTKLTEDGELSDMGKYNKYTSGYYLEYFIESYINDGIIDNKELEIGESITYYYVLSFLDYEFTEETWVSLDESDMWLRFYDDENNCECFFGTEL